MGFIGFKYSIRMEFEVYIIPVSIGHLRAIGSGVYCTGVYRSLKIVDQRARSKK